MGKVTFAQAALLLLATATAAPVLSNEKLNSQVTNGALEGVIPGQKVAASVGEPAYQPSQQKLETQRLSNFNSKAKVAKILATRDEASELPETTAEEDLAAADATVLNMSSFDWNEEDAFEGVEFFQRIPISLSVLPQTFTTEGDQMQADASKIFPLEADEEATDNNQEVVSERRDFFGDSDTLHRPTSPKIIAESLRATHGLAGGPDTPSVEEVRKMLSDQDPEKHVAKRGTYKPEMTQWLANHWDDAFAHFGQLDKLHLIDWFLNPTPDQLHQNTDAWKQKYMIVYKIWPPYDRVADETFDDPRYGDRLPYIERELSKLMKEWP